MTRRGPEEMSEHTYAIRRAKDGQFYFVKKAANNEVTSTSETYPSMQHAIRGAHDDGAPTTEPIKYEGEVS
jgi:uncharacterized protein YegP (UPF0339 family)